MTHQSVLTAEVLEWLITDRDGFYCDATLGEGGHFQAILACLGERGRLVGLDWDERAVAGQKNFLQEKKCGGLFATSYSEIKNLWQSERWPKFTGILADLGFSSRQLESPEYGLSFMCPAPLDMRLDSQAEITAAEIVNEWPAVKLEKIFHDYGEERFAKKIARHIVTERKKRRLATTSDLVAVVLKACPGNYRHGRIHPATRTFQALRIAVNDELRHLQKFMNETPQIMASGGRLVVISFHSLEDRVVKHTIKNAVGLRVLTKKPLKPGAAELQSNPRARSAKMRVAEKL